MLSVVIYNIGNVDWITHMSATHAYHSCIRVEELSPLSLLTPCNISELINMYRDDYEFEEINEAHIVKALLHREEV